MGRDKKEDGFAEKKCCICGRVFIPAVEHIYRANGRWCCTWPCYVELKAQIEATRAAERARRIAARKAKEGKNAERVAIGTGCRGRRPLQEKS